MLKKVTSLLFLVSTMSFAQLEFSNWYFGSNAGINFTEENSNYVDDSSIFLGYMPATISDSEGNLLFYSNGKVIWDRTHNVMQNGEDIEGGFFSYGSSIVPKPGDPNIYYFIYVDYDSSQDQINKMYYSEIDMTLNNGLGGVNANKNILISAEQLGAKLTVAQHANDEDFWLVTHGINNANYYAFLISENGITSDPVISTNGDIHYGSGGNLGAYLGGIKISHDVKKIATVYKVAAEIYDSKVDITNFNDQTGEVYGEVLTLGEDSFVHDVTGNATGSAEFVEFSPNNKYLYVSCTNVFGVSGGTWYPSTLYQYDITTNSYEDLLFSQREIDRGIDRYRGLELGIDNKIYVVVNDYDQQEDDNGVIRSMGVINYPDLQGESSDYQHLSYVLSEDMSRQSRGINALPQDIRGFFYLKIETQQLCAGQGVRFGLDTGDEILEVEWNFGDGTTANDVFIDHQYSPGTYNVVATVTFENSVIQRSVIVEIEEEIDLAESFILCDDASNDGTEEINLDDIRGMIYRHPSCGNVDFYLTESDAQQSVNPLDDLYNNVTNPQIIYARIEPASNPGSYQIAPLNIVINPFPVVNSNSFSMCDDETNDGVEVISLASLNNGITGDLFCAKIDYFFNETDANTNTNPISVEFQNVSNPQRIYIRIESLDDGSFTVTPVDVFIKPRPNLNLQEVYYICESGSLEVGIDDTYDVYSWSTGSSDSSTTIFEPGSYSVTTTNYTTVGECSDTVTFLVQESAVPSVFEIETNDLQPHGNSIQVFVDGIGDYEYSLDGTDYQDSPLFENLRLSEHVVFVRDKNGCGTVNQEVLLLIYPKYFTPNNDGINDLWQIKSAYAEPDLSISVFDRYGKMLFTFTGENTGWDGTFNGLDMPVSDYWFVVKRPSKNKTYRGHFTLKR